MYLHCHLHNPQQLLRRHAGSHRTLHYLGKHGFLIPNKALEKTPALYSTFQGTPSDVWGHGGRPPAWQARAKVTVWPEHFLVYFSQPPLLSSHQGRHTLFIGLRSQVMCGVHMGS